MSSCVDTILSRRSIRRFLDKKPSRKVLSVLLRAAASAPSPHNTQPWLFVVLGDESKRKLAETFYEAYLAELKRHGDPDAERKAARARERTLRAPVAVLLCLDRSRLNPRSPGKKMYEEWIMATQSLAAAAENMLLAAYSLGLAACWRAAPLFCQSAVRSALGLPENIEPQAMIEIGYPAAAPKAKTRRPLDEIVLELP